MNSDRQVFFNFFPTFRTLLRSPSRIDLAEELSSLPTHILNDASQLSKCSVKHMFSKHPLSTGAIIQVFHEHHIASITERMSLFVMKVLPRVVDSVVKTSNFKALFLVVFRPLLFPRESALQQFQLDEQALKELGRLYENAVTGCQKLLQSHINPNGMSMRSWSRNADIALQGDRCIPMICFSQDSHLLDRKPRRNRSVQVDWNCSNLWQLKVQVRYWILFNLREQQRLKLPVFLESRKAKSSVLKILPTSMQLLNSLLKNLRGNFTQARKFLLSSWQVVKLLNFARKLQVGRKDIFLLQRASINQALSTVTPIFHLPQCIVECTPTDFHPLNELLLLSDIWIDSVTGSKCQHSSIILYLLESHLSLNVKREGIEPPH